MSHAFFCGELHEELIESGQSPVFRSDDDREAIMKEIEHERVNSPYPHTMGVLCRDKGNILMSSVHIHVIK